jgi:hypothetical protein
MILGYKQLVEILIVSDYRGDVIVVREQRRSVVP